MVVAAVGAAAIVAGIAILGSPSAARARRLDQRRVQDLSGVAQGIDLYWTRRSSLPRSLDELRTETGADITISDPATSAAYEFRPLPDSRYQLCATFEGESRDSERGGAGFWSHRAGRQCFERGAERVR